MDVIFVILLFLLSVSLGTFLGKIKYKSFSFGKSSILFVALFISYLLAKFEIKVFLNPYILKVSLLGFIGSVGVIASKEIKMVLKNHGLKFVVMAIVICLTGFGLSYIILLLNQDLHNYIPGLYVGALTSSPGLASIIENSPELTAGFIGTAYAIAYIPGVISVIAFTQIMAKRKEKPQLKVKTMKRAKFNYFIFALILLIGYILGQLSVFNISLGITGGVLLSSLMLGNISNVKFDDRVLEKIKVGSLSIFLTYVGLKYGKEIAIALQDVGFILFLSSFIVAISSIVVGYFFGKHILKLPTDLLVGSICGGMTSTPGLASASECFEGKSVVSAYGATYPVALILMIIFVNLLI